MTNERPEEIGLADEAPDPEVVSLDAHRSPARRDQDGVSSLHDVEAEQGDEEGVEDAFDADDRALREVGADLDGRDEPEPRLN
jgi:hypothetical protein